jgi:hypothetical protein
MNASPAQPPTRLPNALQQLISAHLEDTGEHLSDIAARGGLPRQTVSGIAHRDGPGGIPRRETLHKLAVGLGVRPEVVELAAAQALAVAAAGGEPAHQIPTPDPRIAQLVGYAEQLCDQHLRALITTARALVRAE